MRVSRLPPTSSRLIALICVLCLNGQVQLATAQTSAITVQVDRPGATIPSTLFGIFFEVINFGADGGLYPERVKNRSFEFPEPLMGWQQIDRGGSKGRLTVLDENPINANNSHYLRMEVEAGGKGFGVMNEGFRGMGVQQGANYTFSLYARRVD
jgi:alpha-L-arabinofuranosidase